MAGKASTRTLDPDSMEPPRAMGRILLIVVLCCAVIAAAALLALGAFPPGPHPQPVQHVVPNTRFQQTK